ncbi:MAG TPA: hypothetical protein VLA19_07040 [Herpetosiphonaceae bacterium]|nr:hypothetical protein [Herpetosiphonaceae bacterium]
MALSAAALGRARAAIAYDEPCLAMAREIGNRRGEAKTSWNAGVLLIDHGEVARGLWLTQVGVDLARRMGDPAAEREATVLERLRQQRTSDSA